MDYAHIEVHFDAAGKCSWLFDSQCSIGWLILLLMRYTFFLSCICTTHKYVIIDVRCRYSVTTTPCYVFPLSPTLSRVTLRKINTRRERNFLKDFINSIPVDCMQHLGVTQTDRVIYVFQLHGRPLHYCNPTEVELRGPPGSRRITLKCPPGRWDASAV